MLKTFLLSFRLRSTYMANTVLYSLKSLPLVRRILPDSLYANDGLKMFALLVSACIELGSVFLGKALYLGLMIYLPVLAMPRAADSFLHVLFFMTVTGALLNTNLFNPTRDKYYAMVLMRMDAREYTLSNYLYFLLKMLVGFLPFALLFGLLAGVNPFVCLLVPLVVCGAKLIISAIVLFDCRDGEKVRNENLPTTVVWAGVGLCCVAAYLPPALGYAMPQWVFVLLAVLCILGGLAGLWYVFRFPHYRRVYHKLLVPENFAMNVKKTSTQALRTSYLKKIDTDVTKTSRKSGYKYFNELFMKRHSKLLTKSAKRMALILLAVVAVVAVGCRLVPDVSKAVNGLMLTYLPYFLFVMYLLNRGRNITQAMFMNCDHSMLAYRFYRQPKVILSLFTQRLKYVIAIDLIPSSVLALGLPLLLFVTGGTDDPLNYLLLFTSIVAMSVFFSVHNMVLYYLLQPYNLQMEIKNAAYTAVSWLTYLVCYIAIGKEMPTVLFGAGISVFCVLYVIVALILAYRLAPKTFKLRP